MYESIRKQSSEKLTALMNDCGVFFAFSSEQFNENKTPLKEGEKYVSIGAGGYMPKGKVNDYLEGSKAINQWEKEEIKKQKDGKESHILYELKNYECFYSCDIEDAANVLPYPKKDIWKVYLKHKEKEMQF